MSYEFQVQVRRWVEATFGDAIASDRVERTHRFLEEALELAQACGAPKEDALALVDYVYGRQKGEITQEVGGVMLTLMALCSAQFIDAYRCGQLELSRVWKKIEVIREKQRLKPKIGPLPGPTPILDEHHD